MRFEVEPIDGGRFLVYDGTDTGRAEIVTDAGLATVLRGLNATDEVPKPKVPRKRRTKAEIAASKEPVT